MKQVFLAAAFLVMVLACKKNALPEGEGVEIYLLKSSQLVAGKCQVDAATAVLEDRPLVSNQDILQYSRSDYQFTVTGTSFQKVKALSPRAPFAVTVNKKVIYYGIHMPSILSSTCDNSITMDAMGPGNMLLLRLGYPWAFAQIDDRRNDPEIIAMLKKQGKLR